MELFIVATPIGNLKDITLRALETLKEVDFILCEDTRRTIKLLNHYEIKKPLISYHQHSKIGKVEKIINLLKQDKKIALVSDAGSPGISDPGNKLIEDLLKEFGEEIRITPIPGVSAVTALASTAGINMDKFVFLGFPPHKKGRKKYFSETIELAKKIPVIFYESPYRITKALEELRGVDSNLRVIIGNDLTKKFEKIYRGNVGNVLEEIKDDTARGEYVVIIK